MRKPRSELSPDLLRLVLNKLVLSPRLKRAARDAGVDPTTLFSYISRSRNGDPVFAAVTWLDVVRPFHEHVEIARKMSIVAMDASARDQAINGWSEKKFHDGEPVWKRDPKLVADALDPEWWETLWGNRPITDTYARDANGALIQEEIFHPPNPALLVKMLASLAPDVYGERSEVLHTHQGGVWIENDKPAQLAAPAQNDLHDTFQMTKKPDPVARSTNVLAIPQRCETSEDFDKKFRKKLVREVTLFRDVKGALQPPLGDDVIVRGSWQDEEFTKAGILHTTVTAEELIAQGYENDFLRTEVEPPTPKRVLNEIDAAIERLDGMPDNDMKRDMLKRLQAIKSGETNPRPLDANVQLAPETAIADTAVRLNDALKAPQRPKPPPVDEGIGAGPDPHFRRGYGPGMRTV